MSDPHPIAVPLLLAIALTTASPRAPTAPVPTAHAAPSQHEGGAAARTFQRSTAGLRVARVAQAAEAYGTPYGRSGLAYLGQPDYAH